jgi:hypothetical protein
LIRALLLAALLLSASASAQVVVNSAVIADGVLAAAVGGDAGPFTFVASAVGEDDGPGTTTIVTTSNTLNVQTGDLLIAYVTHEDTGRTVSTLNDTGSNTFTCDAGEEAASGSNQVRVQPCYRLAGVSNAAATFTATLTDVAPFKKLIVMQYRPAGCPTSCETVTKDVSGTRENTGTGQTFTTGTFSTTGTDGVVCAGAAAYGSGAHDTSVIDSVSADQTRQFGTNFVWCRIVSAGLSTVIGSTHYDSSIVWAATAIAFKAE